MGTGLKYTPIYDFALIPERLVDQVRDKTWETKRFYEMAPIILASPLTIIGVFSDEKNLIKGFLWASVDPLSMVIRGHVLSVDKKYQNKGIVKEAIGILKGHGAKVGIDKVRWNSNRPGAYTRMGYKPTGFQEFEV